MIKKIYEPKTNTWYAVGPFGRIGPYFSEADRETDLRKADRKADLRAADRKAELDLQISEENILLERLVCAGDGVQLISSNGGWPIVCFTVRGRSTFVLYNPSGDVVGRYLSEAAAFAAERYFGRQPEPSSGGLRPKI